MNTLLVFRHEKGVDATLTAESQPSGSVRLTLAVRAGSRVPPHDIDMGLHAGDDRTLLYIIDRMREELTSKGFIDIGPRVAVQ